MNFKYFYMTINSQNSPSNSAPSADEFAPKDHTHTLYDITDFPEYKDKTNSVLSVQNSKLTWLSLDKISVKIDNSTIIKDANSEKIKVNTNLFVSKDHTHSLDQITDFPDYKNQKNKYLYVNEQGKLVWENIKNVDKVDGFDVDNTKDKNSLWTSDKINSELSKKADKEHSHYLYELLDVPNYQGHFGKFLVVNKDGNAIEYKDGFSYLTEKIDGTTIIADKNENKIKVNTDIFASKNHTHTLDQIIDFPDYKNQKNKILTTDENGNFLKWTDLKSPPHKSSINFYNSGYQISKSYANYLIFSKLIKDYFILTPSDFPNEFIKYGLVNLKPNESIKLKLNIKNKIGYLPKKLIISLIPHIKDVKIKLSYDDKNYVKYTNETEIDILSDTLYIKLENTSEKDVYFYGLTAIGKDEKNQILFTDEKVKADKNDPTPSYLSDKVDNSTIIVDLNTYKLKIKEKAINKKHLDFNIDASDLNFNADKVDGFDVDNTKDENVLWTSDKINSELSKKADKKHTHTLNQITDFPDYQGKANYILLTDNFGENLIWESLDKITDPNLDKKIYDIYRYGYQISKSYAVYLNLKFMHDKYIILTPSDFPQKNIENGFVFLNPNETIKLSFKLTNEPEPAPQKVVLSLLPYLKEIKAQISFDDKIYQDYNFDTEINTLSNQLYIKLTNTSDKKCYLYSLVASVKTQKFDIASSNVIDDLELSLSKTFSSLKTYQISNNQFQIAKLLCKYFADTLNLNNYIILTPSDFDNNFIETEFIKIPPKKTLDITVDIKTKDNYIPNKLLVSFPVEAKDINLQISFDGKNYQDYLLETVIENKSLSQTMNLKITNTSDDKFFYFKYLVICTN